MAFGAFRPSTTERLSAISVWQAWTSLLAEPANWCRQRGTVGRQSRLHMQQIPRRSSRTSYWGRPSSGAGCLVNQSEPSPADPHSPLDGVQCAGYQPFRVRKRAQSSLTDVAYPFSRCRLQESNGFRTYRVYRLDDPDACVNSGHFLI